ncbi:MAG: DUF456 domain-containing protein [Flavobacteriaceae bacterium]
MLNTTYTMDLFLIGLGGFFILLGIIGSFLPVLPGPPTTWVGFLMLYFTSSVTLSLSFLLLTLGIALLVFSIDTILSVFGVKKMGGGRAGIIGSTIGLIIGLLFFGPLGILLGPFVGAFLGELLFNKSDMGDAFKSASGALLGFLSGVFLKFLVSLVFAYYFVVKVWESMADILL